jgi:uncharacterized protein (DUF58 family)
VEVEQVFARFREIKQGIRTRKKSGSIWFGEHRSPFQGSGYDLVGVDQWRPGQPLKDVAWSLSLRTYPHKLFRIERMEPKQVPTVLAVDLSSSTLFEISRESSKALLLLDLIGGIGLTRANIHDPVGLLAFSDRIELYLKPKLGSSQVFHIAHEIFRKVELARAFPARRRADFSLAFRFLASRLKMRHSIVMISDVVDVIGNEESIDFKALRQLGSRHDVVVLIIDDPDEFDVPGRFGFLRISNLETGGHTVISARKAPSIRRGIEEARQAVQLRFRRECGVDSEVLTPRNYFETLSKFLMTRGLR